MQDHNGNGYEEGESLEEAESEIGMSDWIDRKRVCRRKICQLTSATIASPA